MKIDASEYIEGVFCILLLTACVMLGLGSTIASHDRIVSSMHNTFSDKNTQSMKGSYEAGRDTNDSMLSLQGAILTIETQDYNMPETKWIAAVRDGEMLANIELTDRYRDTLVQYSFELARQVGALVNGEYFDVELMTTEAFNEEYEASIGEAGGMIFVLQVKKK